MYLRGCGGEMIEGLDRANKCEPWVVAIWYENRSLPCWQGILIRWVAIDKQEAIDWCSLNPGCFTMSAATANILLEQTHRPTFLRAVNLDSSHN
jgi:hypothetical protein